MAGIPTLRLTRRGFLGSVAAVSAAAGLRAAAVEPPPVTQPRATSGDAVEPDWDERLTITVGPATRPTWWAPTTACSRPRSTTWPRLGGGTVQVLPGTLPAAQRRLPAVQGADSGQRAGNGAGQRAFGHHQAGRRLRLVRPGDHAGRRQGIPSWATAFACGPATRTTAAPTSPSGRWWPAAATASSSTGPCARTSGFEGETTVSTLFPLLSGEEISDVTHREPRARRQPDQQRTISTATTPAASSARTAAGCRSATSSRGTTTATASVGRSATTCVVEDCHSHDNADLGLHPGSGSQRPVDPQQPPGAQRHRPVLLLGRQVSDWPKGTGSRTAASAASPSAIATPTT